MTTITGTKAPTRLHAKPRTPAHELRRRVSDAWHAYICTLPHAIQPDSAALRMLDELVAATTALRNSVADSLGRI